MERLRAFWNKGWTGKVVLGVAGLLSICCVASVVVAALSPTPTAQAPTGAAPTAPVAAQATAAPEPTSAPTVPPPPTATPGPTNTPEPSATPEPTATPTPLPEPIVLKGAGKAVTDPFILPASINRVTLTHKGSRNFIVQSYGAGDKQDYLVNTIGAYNGIRPMIGEGEWYLEVNADGAWEIAIEPVGGEAGAAQGIEGSGDYVSGLFEPTKEGAVPYNIKHTGKRNFIVQIHCAGGRDVAANEIGAVEGSVVVRFGRGPCLWEVQADGDWSVKPK